MTADLLAFTAYAFVTSITPGPNNTMLLASGVNFGFRRSVPHVLGIAIGFAAMVLAVGLGLGAAFAAWPALHIALRWMGVLFLLYLAVGIARSGGAGAPSGPARPLSFGQAAAFQWVNPKAWIMATGAVATYTPQAGFLLNIVVVAGVFALVNAPCVAVWAGLGSFLSHSLADPRRRRAFNLTMAGLLVLSLVPLLAAP